MPRISYNEEILKISGHLDNRPFYRCHVMSTMYRLFIYIYKQKNHLHRSINQLKIAVILLVQFYCRCVYSCTRTTSREALCDTQSPKRQVTGHHFKRCVSVWKSLLANLPLTQSSLSVAKPTMTNLRFIVSVKAYISVKWPDMSGQIR